MTTSPDTSIPFADRTTSQRIRILWGIMIATEAAPRGSVEDDALAYRLSPRMVGQMRADLAAARSLSLRLVDDYFHIRDGVAQGAATLITKSALVALETSRAAALDEIAALRKEVEGLKTLLIAGRFNPAA